MPMTKQEMLADARAKYHQLSVGGMPRVVVDQNGARVEYAAANKQNLYAYIQSLESQLGCVPTMQMPTGPATFLF